MKWIRFLLVVSIVLALMGVQPQSALADVTLSPTDDAFVRDKDGQRDSNFDGHADEISVTAEGFPSGVPVDIGYLRFDLSSASSVIDVQLRLYNQASPGSAVNVGLYSTANDDWNGATAGLGDETTLTFNNAPAEASLLDAQTGASTPAWMEFSSAALISYVNDQIAGDGTVTFRVKVTSTGMADVNVFEDRENGGGTSNMPELVLVPADHTHWGETWSGSGVGLTLNSSTGTGLYGKSKSVDAYTSGVYGESHSTDGAGVYGLASATTGTNYGVYGKSKADQGSGVYAGGASYGIYGESASNTGRGVVGVAGAKTGVAYGVIGVAESAPGVDGIAAAVSGSTTGVLGQVRSPDGWAGWFSSSVGNGLYVSVPAGNKGISVASGTKNAVVPTEDGARLLYAEEATEVWFADYGTGRLQAGAARIEIDPVYAQTVNLSEPYHVFVQAYGDAVLYVSGRTETGFEVRQRSGETNATFFYRIVAKRLGHEDRRLERLPWADNDPNLNLSPEPGQEIRPPSAPVSSRERPKEIERIAPAPLDSEEAPNLIEPPLPATAHDHWGENWSGAGTGLKVVSDDDTGVIAESMAPDGPHYGVFGESHSTSGRGVFGYAYSTVGTSSGVQGHSAAENGSGVYGFTPAVTGNAYGVFGYSLSTAGVGALGLSIESSGQGVLGVSHSTSGRGALGYATASSGSTIGVQGEAGSDTGWSGWFTSSVGNGIYISVPPGKVGLNVASGTKNAVVATQDGARLLYAEEASEVWFADYGFGHLQDGAATVEIDPIYAQTVALSEPYHVFVQVYGDAEIYVAERGESAFEVRLREGDAGAGFSYRVVAKRLGYERPRLERAPWADGDPNFGPQPDRKPGERLAPNSPPQGEQPPTPRGDDAARQQPQLPLESQGGGAPGRALVVVDRARAPQALNGADQRVPIVVEQPQAVDLPMLVAHDHWLGDWSGTGVGLTLISADSTAIEGISSATLGGVSGAYGLNRSSTGDGVRGVGSAGFGTARGVYGRSESTGGRGVYGLATHGSGTTYGVWADNAFAAGPSLYGLATAPTGATFGVYGRSASTSGIGLYGNGTYGVRGEVNSPTGWAAKFTTSQGNGVYVSVPAGKVGLNVASGTKNAVVRTEDGARLLYVEEATEVWFVDYGFAQLQEGVATVAIDALFAQTVNLAEDYHVSVQAYGDAQLYVSQRNPEGFEVRLREGDPNAAFSYRLVARRLGYEGHRLERAPWADDDPNLFPERGMDWAALEGVENYIEPEERQPIVEELDTLE